MFYIFIQVLSSQRQGQKQSLFDLFEGRWFDTDSQLYLCSWVCIYFLFIYLASFSFSRRINICYIKPRGYTTLTEHAEDILDKILCTFTIGCSSTRNSLLFSNFTQRILHHIYFMYHTIKILVVL